MYTNIESLQNNYVVIMGVGQDIFVLAGYRTYRKPSTRFRVAGRVGARAVPRSRVMIHMTQSRKEWGLTHRARTPRKWTQMDQATFGLRFITPSQKQNAFSIITWMLGIYKENSSGEPLTVFDHAVSTVCVPCVRYASAGYGKRQSECP